MEIVSTGAALGADVWNVDLADLTDTAFAKIHQAWLDHNGVLRFPCQRLDAFSLSPRGLVNLIWRR